MYLGAQGVCKAVLPTLHVKAACIRAGVLQEPAAPEQGVGGLPGGSRGEEPTCPRRGAWWAAVQSVMMSRTQRKGLSTRTHT